MYRKLISRLLGRVRFKMARFGRNRQLSCFLGVLLSGYSVASSPRSPPDKISSVTQRSKEALKEKSSVNNFNNIEPGFDFDEEEIKRLKLWPYGIVSYYIDDISYDKVLRDRIRNFLGVTGSLTGLHFQELPSPPEDEKIRWVFFINRLGLLGCSDHTILNFTNEGVQRVTLGYHCMSEGGELAEAILAIAGVPPQHNAPNRDAYITVDMQSVILAKRYLFQILEDKEWLFHDLEYDFASAGHFNFHKHTINGKATIKPQRPFVSPVGENNGFSNTDILKIQMLYNYISKHKSKNIKAPKCHKLFEIGSKFKLMIPDQKEEIAPRPKPRKYLVLLNDSNKTVAKYKSDSVHENDDEELHTSNENISKEDNIVKVNHKSVSKLKDPLSLLSDYDTDDVKQKNKEKFHIGKQKRKPRIIHINIKSRIRN